MKKIFLLLIVLVLILTSCETSGNKNEEVENGGTIENEKYVPTDTTLLFSDENADKVITEPTFDITQYTNEAGYNIKPYQIFSDGMCLQRDAVNRLWGKAAKTNFIAAEINGKVYYGTVKSREWEIYLPKMNAGGPYELTIITEAGK